MFNYFKVIGLLRIIDNFSLWFLNNYICQFSFVSNYNDNMIYIDTGHHSSRSCDGRHCSCLVNLQRFYSLLKCYMANTPRETGTCLTQVVKSSAWFKLK